MADEHDLRVRLAAFQWLTAQRGLYPNTLPRGILEQGFDFHGLGVPLLGPQGIFKPALLTDGPLSITTIPGRYGDVEAERGLLRYAYRGEDPQHRDNRGLRRAMRLHLPLVYFYRVVPGEYVAQWPVYVVDDRPAELFFGVDLRDVDAAAVEGLPLRAIAEGAGDIQRGYVLSTFRRRVHQQAFRARVLEAYRTRCALCRLRHQELLDAAHIIADADPEGAPVVPNGLALCKLHHAAFDRHFLAVRPDYLIEVRQSVLEEEDGPMLLHGLKEMHHQPILLPRSASLRPDRDRLEERYAVFLAANPNA